MDVVGGEKVNIHRLQYSNSFTYAATLDNITIVEESVCLHCGARRGALTVAGKAFIFQFRVNCLSFDTFRVYKRHSKRLWALFFSPNNISIDLSSQFASGMTVASKRRWKGLLVRTIKLASLAGGQMSLLLGAWDSTCPFRFLAERLVSVSDKANCHSYELRLFTKRRKLLIKCMNTNFLKVVHENTFPAVVQYANETFFFMNLDFGQGHRVLLVVTHLISHWLLRSAAWRRPQIFRKRWIERLYSTSLRLRSLSGLYFHIIEH